MGLETDLDPDPQVCGSETLATLYLDGLEL